MTIVPISIDIISDVVCPWCYVGMRNFLAAWQQVGHEAVTLRWRPYQLDPTVPQAGEDRKAYMLKKFGDQGRIDAAHERLNEVGVAAGITFDFEAISIAPNTLDAHRLIYWAETLGQEAQTRLVGRLFRAYFEEGQNIGDHEVLASLAADAGMNVAHARELLGSDVNRKEVLEAVEAVQRMGISGVPCFLLEGRYVVSGAQPTDVLANAIRQVAQAKERGELDQQ